MICIVALNFRRFAYEDSIRFRHGVLNSLHLHFFMYNYGYYLGYNWVLFTKLDVVGFA